jgi:multimeric flavodoxin WrbA
MPGKKVLIVLGSPRKGGNSALLAAEVAAGALSAGADVESVFLQGLRVRPCAACGACQKGAGKGCVQKDDMRALYPKLAAADAIVLASPTYWFNLSAQMKAFIDRWYALQGERSGLEGKRMALVMTYADADPFGSGAVNAFRSFQDICAYLGAETAGILHGQAEEKGAVARNRGLMRQAFRLGRMLGKE